MFTYLCIFFMWFGGPLTNREITMLLDTLRTQLKESIKTKDETRKNILRVVIGEATSRQDVFRDPCICDETVIKIIRKIIDGNEETKVALKNNGKETDLRFAKLGEENTILATFLPKTLSQEEIIQELESEKDAIIAFGKPGQAIGHAVRYLKDKGVIADGKVVSEAVYTMRGHF